MPPAAAGAPGTFVVPKARDGCGAGRILAIAALAVVACGAAVEIGLPRYVRSECIARAAAYGIQLTVEGASMSHAGFLLTGVKATASALPGASVEVPEMTIGSHGLRLDTLSLSGMEVQLEGRWSAISAALEHWREERKDQGDGEGDDGAPRSVVIDGSRLVWRGAIGDSATIEASGVHLEAAWSTVNPTPRDPASAHVETTLHATSSQVSVTIPAGTLGPWRVDLDRDASASRARIALDPGVPDTCDVLLVGGAEGITSAEATIPRSPLAHLGIPPSLLGLKGAIQLELALRYVPFTVHGGASATARGGLYGATVEGVPRPLDVVWDLTANGDRAPRADAAHPETTQTIDLTEGRIAAGPLVGNVKGALKVFDDGFRADLSWSAGPVPCTAFDAPLGPGQPFDIGYEIRQLAQNTGIATVHGDVSAAGTLAFDSHDLGAGAVKFTPRVNCDVALGL